MTFYTTHEAAELLGIHYKRLWYAVITGKLHETTRIGRIRLFDDCAMAEMRRFFAAHEAKEARC